MADREMEGRLKKLRCLKKAKTGSPVAWPKDAEEEKMKEESRGQGKEAEDGPPRTLRKKKKGRGRRSRAKAATR